MNSIFSTLAHHAYLSLAVVVFLEAVGIPIPAALAIMAAGAAAAMGALRPDVTVAVALVAMMAGDLLLFMVGRKTGWWLLGILCRLSANPESCILTSADSFYRRGRATLVVAKFIPAINTMAPPLAGSMRMRLPQFLALDAAGALLYIVGFGALGYAFSGLIARVTRVFDTASRLVEWLMVVGLIVYAAYRVWLYWKNRVYRVVPRVPITELARRVIEPEQATQIVIVDVRSHSYYEAGAQRIAGSIRLDPNRLPVALHELPKDKDIYLYCT
jgi:membrane protein DedA with SNARE-associated domain